uniref:Uncharacterized protein n=1 Tax=Desmonostoc muscorum LEGE 12446 TaxID=1828758 RepID=A0A8J7A0A0_DESMC
MVKSAVQAIAIISPKALAETLIISSTYKSFRSTEISTYTGERCLRRATPTHSA